MLIEHVFVGLESANSGRCLKQKSVAQHLNQAHATCGVGLIELLGLRARVGN